jgi:hypothetical protein
MKWKGLWWNYGKEKWFYTQSDLLRNHVNFWVYTTELGMNLLNGENGVIARAITFLGKNLVNILSSTGLKILRISLNLNCCCYLFLRNVCFHNAQYIIIVLHLLWTFSLSLLEYYHLDDV